MSMVIYPAKSEPHPTYGQVMSPVIDFECWHSEIPAEDAEERSERGEDAYIPNPKYIPNAGMDLSSANAETLFSLLGFEIDPTQGNRFPIDDLHSAVMRGLNGPAADHTVQPSTTIGARGATIVDCGIPAGYMQHRLKDLLGLIAAGQKFGATHVVVC